MTTRNALVVLSGGLDSTSTLAVAVDRHGRENVRALGFDYGQRHARELDAARAVSAHYGIPYEVRDISGTLHGSALIDHSTEVPRAGYDAETMADTVVHGRNLLFASLAVSALAGEGSVYLGVHGGDHHIYPDCRPEFWIGFRELAGQAYGVEVVTPFLHSPKSDVVREGYRQAAPLGLTWSCYVGGPYHCGECGTCVERREAFKHARVVDPTTYVR